jgi:membrane-associated PAP2 superfamily phosphatase
VNALLFSFTLGAQPFLAPFLHRCQNIRLITRMFQLHPFEKNFELHCSHWLQGILHSSDELGIIHTAFIQLSPGGLREPTSRLDCRPKLCGYQGL